MLIWRGRGLVVLLAIVVFGIIAAIVDGQGGRGYFDAHAWPKLLATFVSAGGLFVIGTKFEESGRRDDFFFVPVRYCAVIIFAGGLFFSFVPTHLVPVPPPRPDKQLAQELPTLPARPAELPREAGRPHATFEQVVPPSPAPPQPVPPPAARTAEPEPPKSFVQVYVDMVTKTYYPEGCEHPANAVRMSKGAALHQRYTLASTCPP